MSEGEGEPPERRRSRATLCEGSPLNVMREALCEGELPLLSTDRVLFALSALPPYLPQQTLSDCPSVCPSVCPSDRLSASPSLHGPDVFGEGADENSGVERGRVAEEVVGAEPPPRALGLLPSLA